MSCVTSSCTGIRYWSSLSQNASFPSSSSALHTSCWHRDRMCHECTQHSLWSALWVYLARSCISHVATAQAGRWFPLLRGRGAMSGADELRALSDRIAQLASLLEEVNANCVALLGANSSSPPAATTVQYGSTHTRDTVPDKPRAPMIASTPLKECAATPPTTTRTHAQPSGFRRWPRQQGKNAEASAPRINTHHHIDTRSDLLQHTNTSSVNPRTVKTLSWLFLVKSLVLKISSTVLTRSRRGRAGSDRVKSTTCSPQECDSVLSRLDAPVSKHAKSETNPCPPLSSPVASTLAYLGRLAGPLRNICEHL